MIKKEKPKASARNSGLDFLHNMVGGVWGAHGRAEGGKVEVRRWRRSGRNIKHIYAGRHRFYSPILHYWDSY